MSVMEIRGGFPRVSRFDSTVTGGMRTTGQITKQLIIRVTTFPVRLYFNEADFDANADYITVTPISEFNAPVEVVNVWLRGVGGTAAVEMLAILRRN